MEPPINHHDIEYVEGFLVQGELERALPVLEAMRRDTEAYIAAELEPDDRTQYFSFDTTFERLAYRRVEDDPRQIVQVDIPIDRLYADLAYVHIRQQRWEPARDALMQAVRWNPMNASYRLDLAELFGMLGDRQEWASLSFSVLERAADPVALARAYANLGQFLLEEDKIEAAGGCMRLAAGFKTDEQRTIRLTGRLAREHPELDGKSDEQLLAALAEEGIPTGANAEIAVCLLMCAADAARAGQAEEATRFTVRARDLIGEAAAKALIRLIRETDAEATERGDDTDGESDR